MDSLYLVNDYSVFFKGVSLSQLAIGMPLEHVVFEIFLNFSKINFCKNF